VAKPRKLTRGAPRLREKIRASHLKKETLYRPWTTPGRGREKRRQEELYEFMVRDYPRASGKEIRLEGDEGVLF